MIYYHKYASDRYMEWATIEGDDIMQLEEGNTIAFEYDDELYDWIVSSVDSVNHNTIHVECETDNDILDMTIKYRSRLEEYSITLNRSGRTFTHTVCSSDKYPFGEYNPYDGH